MRIENFENFEISNQENIIGGKRRKGRKRKGCNGYQSVSVVSQPVLEMAPAIMEPEIIRPSAPASLSFPEADISSVPIIETSGSTIIINLDALVSNLITGLNQLGLGA